MITIDWGVVKGFVDYCDRKSQRVSSRPMKACQCGKLLRFGSDREWNCGPACITPVKTAACENRVNPGTEQDGSGRRA